MLKTHAVQTLRDCRASSICAKRLECGAFTAAFPLVLRLDPKHILCKGASAGYLPAMSTVTEIKTAFKRLPEREQWKLAEWIQETLESFETLDTDGARGREPVSSVMSVVRRVKRERREAYRRS